MDELNLVSSLLNFLCFIIFAAANKARFFVLLMVLRIAAMFARIGEGQH